jgi:hypothetical protein
LVNTLRSKILSLLSLALLAAPVGGQTLQTRTGDAGWRALTADGSHCVADGAGAREICWPADPGSMLSDIAQVGAGWIAAGATPGARGSRLFLVRGDGARIERLEPPPGASASRGRPQLLTDDDRLRGLVWLEGERQEVLEVRAAQWLGTTWTPPQTISPTGVGSQVAPSATLLADQRWLVVWTAFDGDDDETRWSTWDGERWSPPAPVHEDNKVPDITPSVLATGDGAVAAWSWFDGSDYRLRLAFFDGRSWQERKAESGRGVGSPRVTTSRGDLLLSFSSVVPQVWVALELDAAGHVVRRTELASGQTTDPWVDSLGYGVRFEWPGAAPTVISWGARP